MEDLCMTINTRRVISHGRPVYDYQYKGNDIASRHVLQVVASDNTCHLTKCTSAVPIRENFEQCKMVQQFG